MSILLYWLSGFVILISLFFSALFSGTETGFLSINKMKLRSLVEAKNHRAMLVHSMLKDIESFLAEILVGNNIAMVVASSLSTFVCVAIFGDIGSTISTVAMTIILVQFCEIIPKALFRQYPDALIYKSVGVLRFFLKILSPIAKVFTTLTKLFSSLFHVEQTKSKSPFVTREEVSMLVRAGEKEGVLEAHEKEMINSIISFKETKAGEVMVPLTDVVAVDVNASLAELKELTKRYGYTRFPVFEKRVYNITGVINVFEILYKEGKGIKWQQYIRKVLCVPANRKIDSLIRELQKRHEMMAVVISEYGSSVGIVTIEDMMEEVVGEIYDESEERVVPIRKVGDGTFMLDGRASIDLLNKKMNLGIQTGEYETISGYIFDRLERVPQAGEKILEKDYSLIIEKMDKNRIVSVKLVLNG